MTTTCTEHGKAWDDPSHECFVVDEEGQTSQDEEYTTWKAPELNPFSAGSLSMNDRLLNRVESTAQRMHRMMHPDEYR